MWQRLERKISFLNCLFVYFIIIIFCHPHFSFFFFLLFLLSAFFFHPHFSICIFPSASAIRRYPVRALQTPLHSWCFDSRISNGLLLLRFRSQFTSVTKCCGCPFFYSALRASVALRATCRAPARIWLAVIDFQNGEQQSRSGSDKKRRNRLQQIHKDPIGLINRAKRQVYTFFKVRLWLSNLFIHTKLLWTLCSDWACRM